MRSVLAKIGHRTVSESAVCAPISKLARRWESTGRETCFGDMFDTTVADMSQPHIAPEHGVPGSVEGNTYLQEVGQVRSATLGSYG